MQNTTYLSFLFYFAENLHVFKIESRVYQDGEKKIAGDSKILFRQCFYLLLLSRVFLLFFYAALRLLLKTEAWRRPVPTQAELVSVLLTADNKHEK